VILAVGGWRGVGATTTALLAASCLAAADPDGAWLIEADPAGGVLAGRMQLPPRSIGGLERVAFPTERAPVTEALEHVAHTIGDMRLVAAPADPFRAFACHQPRMPWVAALRELPGSVVIDVGRLRGGTPVWPLLALADSVLLVAAPEISAAVSAAEWLQAGGRVSPADPGLPQPNARIVFVESAGSVGFPRATLLGELGDQCAGWLPWEESAVDFAHRGATAHDRRLRRSPLMGAVNQMVLGVTLAQGVAR